MKNRKKIFSETNFFDQKNEFNQRFVGWTIEHIGKTDTVTQIYDDGDVVTFNLEGGLTFILYREKYRKRIVMGYNECGEWIEGEEMLNE
jgi:hypothetical protein